MANKFFGAISHIGGSDGDLDSVSKDILSDGDAAFIVDSTNNIVDVYTCDSSNATAEDATNFTCIVPDDEAASPGFRWIKVGTGYGMAGTNSVIAITDIAAALKSGADTTLLTGTAGTNGNVGQWNADGDLVDTSIQVTWIDQDVSSGSTPTLTATNITGAPADFIDAITEIAAALKTGADTKLVTGTAGTNGNLSQWNTDGDLVDTTLTAASIPETDEAGEWTAQQNFNEATITSTSNAVAIDMDTDQCAVHTLTENTTFGAPSNLNAGATYQLRIVQAAGLYTIAFNAVFDFGESSAPVAPAANGDVLVLSFYSDGTNVYGVVMNRSEA